MTRLKSPGDVRIVYRIEEFTAPEEGVDVVIVPGAWIDYPPDQYRNACSWVKPLVAATAHDTRVFYFGYHLHLDGISLWQQLLGQGTALLDGLERFRREPGYGQRPLLFIAHSLGGLIVKKALSSAYQHHQAYEDVTAGLIFLGSPHVITDSSDDRNSLQLIMRANRKDISKENLPQEEFEGIVSICRSFSQLPLNVPIFSIYEGKETKVKEKLLSSLRSTGKPSIILVPEKLAVINHRKETLLKTGCNHAELCNIQVNSPVYQSLVMFFRDFAEHAPANVAIAFRQVALDGPKNLVLRTKDSFSSIPDNVLSGEDISSNSGTNSSRNTSEHRDTPQGVQLPFSHIATIVKSTEFFGREEVLKEIDEKLTPRIQDVSDRENCTQLPKTYVLGGMGGVGKTETAIEYVFRTRAKFDAVFWVTADTTRKLADQYMAIAKELELDCGLKYTLNESSAREAVKAWFAHPKGYYPRDESPHEQLYISWLLVLDNADDPDILHDWIPMQGAGSLLVTGRYPYLQDAPGNRLSGTDMTSLDTESAADMLRKLSRREDDVDSTAASNRIASLLGGLPLAISQMSAVIRRKQLSLSEFEEYYSEDSRALHSMRIKGATGNYQHTIWTTWAVEQLNPAALALLNVLSVLDPDRIPEKMLIESSKKVLLGDYPKTKSRYFEARAELVHSSLVVRNMATNELRLHRLVQDVVRQRLTKEQLHEVFDASVILLSGVWPFVSSTDATRNQAWRYTVGDKYTAHIRRLETLFGPAIREGVYSGSVSSGVLYSSYAWYTYERGNSVQSIAFAELAKIILTTAKHSEPTSEREITAWLCEAYSTTALAKVMTNTGDGMGETNKWIEILLERIGRWNLASDALALGTAYNQIAVSYMKKGDTEEAIKSWKHSLEAFKNLNDPPQFCNTWPAVNIALVYAIEGKPEEGEAVLTPVLEEHERVLGRDDRTTAESGGIWRAMGNIRRVQKRIDDAIDFHERAVANHTAVLGEKHEFAAVCQYTLARDYVAVGKPYKALTCLDVAISVFTAEYQKPQRARALWKKGLVYRGFSDTIESDALLKEAMRLRRELKPDDKRDIDDLTDRDWDELVFYYNC